MTRLGDLLCCDRCQFTTNTDVTARFLGQLLVYDLGKPALAPVLAESAWCRSCRDWVPVERIPDAAELESLVAKFRRLAESSTSPSNKAFGGAVANSAAQWRTWADSRRNSDRRCLCCGSDQHGAAVPAAGELHPGCGGSMQIKQAVTPQSKPGTSSLRKYERDGRLHVKPTSAPPASTTPPAPPKVTQVAQIAVPQGKETSLHQSPFWLIGASTRDNRQRIVELADEHSLSIDDTTLRETRTMLTNPRKRLGAELAWFPGVDPERVIRLVTMARDNVGVVMVEDDLPPLAQANLLCSNFEQLTDKTPIATAGESIARFCDLIDRISPEATLRSINADRTCAAFPPLNDVGQIQEGLRERTAVYRTHIKALLDQLTPMQLIATMSKAVQVATHDASQPPPRQLVDLIDAYEVEAQGFLQAEATNLQTLIQRAREILPKDSAQLSQLLDRIERLVRNWHRVAQPVLLARAANGLEHRAARELATAIRSFGVFLINEHQRDKALHRLVTLLQELFSHMPSIANLINEDLVVLEKIARNTQVRDTDLRHGETIEINLGDEGMLQASAIGLRYGGKLYPLGSITQLGWSAVRRTVDGVTTGMIHTVIWGNEDRNATLALDDERLVEPVLNLLWRACGYRLMLDLAASVGIGHRYRFGNVEVFDEGVVLLQRTLFGTRQTILKWRQISADWENGDYVIASSANYNRRVVLDPITVPNIPILEQALRAVLRDKLERMSMLLK